MNMRKFANNSHALSLLRVMVIVAVSFAVYFNGLFNNFVYDDVFQVTENQWITDIRYIPAIFTESVWGFQPWSSSSNYYRPLMHLTYMMSYYLFGLKPWGFHLVNILFHAANSVLVFIIASRLLSKESMKHAVNSNQPEKNSRFTLHDSHFAAFIAALLFATHPIHTEAVVWVAGLPEVSFTFFTLFSLFLYMRPETGLGFGYFFSVIFFFAAALYKETALILPAILMAYDYAFREAPAKGRWAGYLMRYVPYVLATGIYLAMRYYALGGLAPEKKHTYLSAYQYVINVFPLFTQYLLKLAVPTHLNAFYVFHPVYSVLESKAILSLAVTSAFIAFTVIAFRKNRLLFFSLLVIGGPLLPALYIPGLGENTFAERYLYLPSVGFTILLATLLARVTNEGGGWAKASAAVFLIIAGLYSAGTVSRNAVWKDDLSLYSDTAGKAPDGFIPNNNLGYALMKAGRMDEAMEKLKIALRLRPDMPDILVNKAVSCLGKGLVDEAMLNLNNVLLLDPGRADGHYYLGLAYALKGWLSQAVDEYREAMRLKPDYPHIHSNLAEVYAGQGRMDIAIAEYEAALKADPSDAQASNNLGVLHMQAGHLDKAIELYRTAVRLKPDDPTFRRNLEETLSMRSAMNGGK